MAIVPGFPFSIIYHDMQDIILILAVAHHYRRPGYWLQRSGTNGFNRQRVHRRYFSLRGEALPLPKFW